MMLIPFVICAGAISGLFERGILRYPWYPLVSLVSFGIPGILWYPWYPLVSLVSFQKMFQQTKRYEDQKIHVKNKDMPTDPHGHILSLKGSICRIGVNTLP